MFRCAATVLANEESSIWCVNCLMLEQRGASNGETDSSSQYCIGSGIPKYTASYLGIMDNLEMESMLQQSLSGGSTGMQHFSVITHGSYLLFNF